MSTQNFGSPELSLTLETRDLSAKMLDNQTARHARNRTIDIPNTSSEGQQFVTPRVMKMSRNEFANKSAFNSVMNKAKNARLAENSEPHLEGIASADVVLPKILH